MTPSIRSPLRTAADVFPTREPIRRLEDYLGLLDELAARRGMPPRPGPLGHDPSLAPAYARVDDGRWLADCPAGCGSSCEAIAGETRYWCSECATGGTRHTAPLTWPTDIDQLTVNLESLPRSLQFWPCRACIPRQAAGGQLCPACRAMQGTEA